MVCVYQVYECNYNIKFSQVKLWHLIKANSSLVFPLMGFAMWGDGVFFY